jgi:myo-inositol 2-dehydrogenase/D-chiro-inositol 1-dehydrogenase
MRTLAIRVIGADQSCNMYRGAMEHLAGFRIEAAADPNPQALQAAGEKLGARQLFTPPEQMLRYVVLDAVIIASPPFFHLEHVTAAALAGCAVFAEKPLARTSVEARAMVDACRSAGVLFMVGFNRRFLPPLRTARK